MFYFKSGHFYVRRSEEELPLVGKLLGLDHMKEEDQINELMDRYSLRLVALTKGSVGSLLVTPGEPLHALHQKAVDISAFVCTQDGAMPDYEKQK